MSPELVGAIVGALGIGGGAVAVYVKLSLPDYTLRVLNGRYPTSKVMDEKFNGVHTEIKALREVIETRLETLACIGGECDHPRRKRA
jgi:hypothetical protein